MNKNIEQVIEIEKQAQEVSQAAMRDAEKLPAQAQEEAQSLLEKTRKEAEAEARRLLENARDESEASRIISEAQQQAEQTKALAEKNIDQAIGYLIDRITGKK